MSSSGLKFIRKDGRIIPLRQAAGGAARAVGKKLSKAHKSTRFAHGVAVGAGLATAANQGTFKSKNPEVKVNKAASLVGLGLSVTSGVIAAATFAGGAKSFLGGAVASHAIDAAGISANIASVAGKGHAKARAEQAAKNEARNFIVGNAVFVGGLFATKANRAALGGYAAKTLAVARKVLRVGSKIE